MFYVIHGSSGHFVLCMVMQRERVPHLTGLCCVRKQIVVIFLTETGIFNILISWKIFYFDLASLIHIFYKRFHAGNPTQA